MQVWDEDLVETIAATLLSIWRFQKLTESRWLIVGAATRVLVRAVLLGLDAFYGFLREDFRGQHMYWCQKESHTTFANSKDTLHKKQGLLCVLCVLEFPCGAATLSPLHLG